MSFLFPHFKTTGNLTTLPAVSEPPGSATPTVHSEIFMQSDRMASFVLMGMQRWGMLSLLGLVFPFLIVSLAAHRKFRQVKESQSGRVSPD